MNKFKLLLLLSLGVIISLHAQDPIFSQFHRSKIYLNPAYTGLDGGFVATVVKREQWGRILGVSPYPGVFSTHYASVEWTSTSLRNGLSAFFLQDKEGGANLRTQYGGMNYCYVIPIEKVNGLHNFRLGFGLYYSKKSIDWDELVFSDQIHPKGEEYFLPASRHAQFFETFEDNPPWWTGLNMGFLYRFSESDPKNNGRDFSVGINGTHVLNLLSTSSIESLQGAGIGLDMRWSLHGSAFFPDLSFGKKGNRFTPIFNGRIDYQGGISAFTLGGDLLFKNVGLGIYYQNALASGFVKSTDALILAIDMEVPWGKEQSIELGLSYDINMNGLSSYTGGVFEIVIKYRRRRFSNSVVCPPVSRAHSARWDNIFYKNIKD